MLRRGLLAAGLLVLCPPAQPGPRYSLDLTDGTAELLEDVRDTRIPSSDCCGSAPRLPDGNWVMSWGQRGTITEMTGSGQPVLTLTMDRGFSYRAQPVSSTVVDRNALRAAMDTQHPR